MGKLKPLIKNQSIRIENHKQGTGEVSVWGSGFHIHKTFIEGPKSGLEILFPIDSNREVEIRGDGYNRNDFPRVQKEIKKALTPDENRAKFVEQISMEIKRFSSGELPLEEVRATARRIASHFDLDDNIISEIVNTYQGKIRKYVSLHVDPDDKSHHEIRQSVGHIEIKPTNYVVSFYLKH